MRHTSSQSVVLTSKSPGDRQSVLLYNNIIIPTVYKWYCVKWNHLSVSMRVAMLPARCQLYTDANTSGKYSYKSETALTPRNGQTETDF